VRALHAKRGEDFRSSVSVGSGPKERESNPQGSSLVRVRAGCRLQSACPSPSSSSGGRNRTCVTPVNSRVLVPARTPPESSRQTVGMAGFEPAVSCSQSRWPTIGTPVESRCFKGSCGFPSLCSLRSLHQRFRQRRESRDRTDRRPPRRVRGEPDRRATPPARRPAHRREGRGQRCLSRPDREPFDWLDDAQLRRAGRPIERTEQGASVFSHSSDRVPPRFDGDIRKEGRE
jgi:hypothetical protein